MSKWQKNNDWEKGNEKSFQVKKENWVLLLCIKNLNKFTIKSNKMLIKNFGKKLKENLSPIFKNHSINKGAFFKVEKQGGHNTFCFCFLKHVSHQCLFKSKRMSSDKTELKIIKKCYSVQN